MAKRNLLKTRVLVATALLPLLFALCFFPAALRADQNQIRSIAITVDLNDDGSAVITEVWDLTVTKGTEWYVAQKNLDQQTISGFTVTDENGRVFEDVGAWDSSLDREQKAGKSGLIETGGGYELCWGFGDYGAHTYTIRYTITNLVKGYSDANGITHYFISDNLEPPPENVRVVIRKPGTFFTNNDTGMWVFGYSADYELQNGEVVVQSDQAMGSGQYVAIMIEFNKEMFSPLDTRSQSFEEVKARGLEGSDYTPGFEDNSVFSALRHMVTSFLPLLFPLGMVLFSVGLSRSRRSSLSGGAQRMKKEYKEAGYSRELPFQGHLAASYTRLFDLGQLENDSVIIGAYLLRWVRSRQVEIVRQPGGGWGNKEEETIKLYNARPDMEPMERRLYDMLVAAAGPDWVLQSKEFERWSKSQYSTVQGWLEQYKNVGKAAMRDMGAATLVQQKSFFGLVSTQATVMTPVGETMTVNMFGFKKYLEDFTIINEREAREVQLWDQYLVFAQLFGIADRVAQQFEQLYPDYFRQAAGTAYGGAGLDMYDVFVITRMARVYSRAMHSGYRAGYNAAYTTRYTGGGGHSSFGGGGGFSGGSGGGGGGGSR